jgi:hypothetical protein
MKPRPKRLSSIDRQDLRIRNKGKCEERWQRKERRGQRRASAAHVTCNTALVRAVSAYDTPICCGVSDLRSGTYFTAGRMSRAVQNPTPQSLFRALFHAFFRSLFLKLFRELSNTQVRQSWYLLCSPMVLNTHADAPFAGKTLSSRISLNSSSVSSL